MPQEKPEKPNKALYYKDLRFKTNFTGSAHTILTVAFTDADGIEKEGYLKLLDSTYPSLLAKYDVAISVFARMVLGEKNAAEDRLVLDDDGNIVATVSLAIMDKEGKPDYKPLTSKISDSLEEAVATLLSKNVARVLALTWVLKDKDRHPMNFSLDKFMDYDESGPIPLIIKGGSFIDGILGKDLEKELSLKKEDISNAPILNRTHHPSQATPANYNYAKQHLSAEAFQFLATNPSLKLDENKSVCFQEQYFSALLLIVLVFDPDMFKALLWEQLRDMPLDFIPPEELDSKDVKSGKFLDKAKADRLLRDKSEFFSEEKNKESFINHIMTVFQDIYDEGYRIVVNYEGCASNIKETSVMSFNDFLRHRPSAYRAITREMEGRNGTMRASWERQKGLEDGKTLEKPDSYFISYSNSMPPEARYNLKAMELLYHQIWRDSNINALNSILQALNTLNEALSCSLNQVPLIMEDYQPLNQEAQELTEGWQCLDNGQKSAEELLAVYCDEQNEIFKGLSHLVQFTEELRGLSNIYWMIPYSSHPIKAQQETDNRIRKKTQKIFATAPWIDKFFAILEEHLTAEQRLLLQDPSLSKVELFLKLRKIIKPSAELNIALNYFYINVIDKLRRHYPTLITGTLEAGELKDKAAKIFEDLRVFRFNMELEAHMSSPDTTLDTVAKASTSAQLMRSHTEPDVSAECFRQLLAWADEYDNLDGQILMVLSSKYSSYWQERVIEVESYLKNNKDSGAIRLQTLFSTGGTESNSFNTCLIAHLVPMMLKGSCGQVGGDNLLCLRDAVAQDSFKAEVYAKAMQAYVLSNENLNHIYSARKVRLLNELMYNWVERQPKEAFKGLVDNSIKAYLGKRSSIRALSYFFTAGVCGTGREASIPQLFDKSLNNSNRTILSQIFGNATGGLEENSLNTILFENIWTELKKEVKVGVDSRRENLRLTETEQFILRVASLMEGKQPPMIFLNSLKKHALSLADSQTNAVDKTKALSTANVSLGVN